VHSASAAKSVLKIVSFCVPLCPQLLHSMYTGFVASAFRSGHFCAGMATSAPYVFVHGGWIPVAAGEPTQARLQAVAGPPSKRTTVWTVRACTAAARGAACAAPPQLALFGDGGHAPADVSRALDTPARRVILKAMQRQGVPGTGALVLAQPQAGAPEPFQRGAVDTLEVEVCGR
jgi:hypothetical protein